MASIGGGDDKKSLVVDLNLVPFIDLMSVCIIFLLITAVWMQVSMIQIGSSVYGKRNETEATPPPRPDVMFRLEVLPTGYVINLGKSEIKLPKVQGTWDEKGLLAQLTEIKTKYPEKTDAIIQMSDELTYDDLILGMDLLLNGGFPEISVATGEAK